MLCSPSSFTITATLFMSGRLSSRLISVVFPLPRKPVTMLTGMRPASGSRVSDSVCARTLDIHFENVETAPETVDAIDDPFLVPPDVVDLDRAGGRHLRRAGDEVSDLLRLVRVGRVERAHPAVEESAEVDRVGAIRRRDRLVLVHVVRAVAA